MENTVRPIVYVDSVNYNYLRVKERLKNDFEVFYASNTKELFSILTWLTPGIILIDISKQHDIGFEIIQKMKADLRYNKIPIIIFSLEDHEKIIIEAVGLGAANFLVKPFTDKELIACLECQLDANRRDSLKPIILAVDDNPTILKVVNQILSSQYKVYTLNKPEELDDFIERIKPDLFLLDYNMPLMDGSQVLEKLRNNLSFSNTPIIFLTSEGKEGRIIDVLKMGANDYILKPINESLLRKKIATRMIPIMMNRKNKFF